MTMDGKVIVSWASALALVSVTLGETLTFKGETDKNPLAYKVGEKMTFTVSLVDRDAKNAPVKGRKLVWKFSGDDGASSKGEATSDEPLVLSTSISKPGFVRLTVNVLDEKGKSLKGKTEKFDGGAGANVAEIESLSEPADFDDFWAKQLVAVSSLKGEVKFGENHSKAKLQPWCAIRRRGYVVRTFELPMGDGERPATGLVAWPEGAQPKSLKLKVRFFGYGWGQTSFLGGDFKPDTLALAVTRHGEETDREADYYTNLKTNVLSGFCFRRTNRPETTDQLKMLLRDWRAIRWAKTLPEWNGSDLTVTGGSMGGFQSLAMAALDKSVTSAVVTIPWHACIYGKAKFGRMGGWFPAWTEALGYFDTANFAKRITCSVDMTIGLGDYTCPPSGEMVLYRNLKGPKKLTAKQNMGHGAIYGVETKVYTFKGDLE